MGSLLADDTVFRDLTAETLGPDLGTSTVKSRYAITDWFQ